MQLLKYNLVLGQQQTDKNEKDRATTGREGKKHWFTDTRVRARHISITYKNRHCPYMVFFELLRSMVNMLLIVNPY